MERRGERLRYHCNYPDCNQSFSRIWNLRRHESRVHENSTFSEHCLLCGKLFFEADKLQKHLIINHGPSDKFYEKESAFRRTVITYRFNFDDNQANFINGQFQILESVRGTIRFEAAQKSIVRVSLVYICQMSMTDFGWSKDTDYFNSFSK